MCKDTTKKEKGHKCCGGCRKAFKDAGQQPADPAAPVVIQPPKRSCGHAPKKD